MTYSDSARSSTQYAEEAASDAMQTVANKKVTKKRLQRQRAHTVCETVDWSLGANWKRTKEIRLYGVDFHLVCGLEPWKVALRWGIGGVGGGSGSRGGCTWFDVSYYAKRIHKCGD